MLPRRQNCRPWNRFAGAVYAWQALRELFEQWIRCLDAGLPGEFKAPISGPAAVTIKQAAIDQFGKIPSINGYFAPVPMFEARATNINGGPISIAFQHFRRQTQNFVARQETSAPTLVGPLNAPLSWLLCK
jgi:hypothetical protein